MLLYGTNWNHKFVMSIVTGVSVLVLGGGLQGLSVSYSLYKTGNRVLVYSQESEFDHCRFVFKRVHFPLTVANVACGIVENGISVVIPMGDKLAEWLSINKKELSERTGAVCAVPDYEVFKSASSKSDLISICQTNGISVPRTSKIDLCSAEEVCRYVGFPALIKPDHSVGARGITQVGSLEDLLAKLPGIIDSYGSCSLQEFIDNPDFYFNAMLYRYGDGSYAPSVIIKILRFYPLSGGSSSMCVTVEDERLESLCKRVLDVLDWHGFADFDVLYDKKDGQCKIIEINPRVPASLRAADAAGINFPQIILCDSLGMRCPDMECRQGIYLRYMGLDILWFLKSRKRFSCTPSWFKFSGKNLYYQDLYKEDKKLSAFTMYEGIKKIFKRR